jgi:hypothetical protein
MSTWTLICLSNPWFCHSFPMRSILSHGTTKRSWISFYGYTIIQTSNRRLKTSSMPSAKAMIPFLPILPSLNVPCTKRMVKASQTLTKSPAFAMASIQQFVLVWPNSLFFPGFTPISCVRFSSSCQKQPLCRTRLLPELLAIPWMSANWQLVPLCLYRFVKTTRNLASALGAVPTATR